MSFIVRIVAVVLLLLLAAACAIGVLATFEPPGWPTLRAVYAGIGALGLAGAGWIVARLVRDAS